MTIIQLGNYHQCMDNGVPVESIYEFGIFQGIGTHVKGFYNAFHNSADSTWNSMPAHRTTFKLEILF